MTLRTRITVLAALAVLAVLAVAGVGLVLAQRAALTEALDETVAQQADALAAELASSTPADALDLPSDDVVAQVVSGDGAVLAASPGLGDGPVGDVPAVAGTTAAELPGDTGRVRLRSTSVGGATLFVAGSLEDVQESTAALAASLAVAVPLSALVLAGIVRWSVGRALRPVEAIRSEVEQISGSRLDRRVTEPASRDEIVRLAHTMNAMLGRLDASAARQRRFVADASHELRSPLARIRSEVEVDLAHPASADHEATHDSVLAEVVTLQALVDDLLLLARADGDAPDLLDRRAVDLDHVVQDVVRRLRPRAGVAVDAGGVAPVQVSGDAAQLRRVVGNLLDNAVRHARTRVTVTLGPGPRGTGVLTVVDDGAGIPPEQRDVVFRRFTRLDDARRSGDGGVGLGLAIARDLAERHGGTLGMHPEPGPGARFVLVLPRSVATPPSGVAGRPVRG